VVEEVLAGGGEFGAPQECDIVVLFADIRGYTTLAEGLAPHILVEEILNRYFCYRTENMSELSCDGIPPGKMEADAQWYPFVMVTKPDDWRRPCPSASRPIVPSNGPWRMPCTRAATVTTSGT
jgi:hypothetical protein